MEIPIVAIGFLGFMAWGDLIVTRLMPWHSDHPLERALTGFGLLFGAGSFIIHALGFAGLLYKPLVYCLLAACLTGIILWLADHHRKRAEFAPILPASRFPLLASALCLMVVANFIGCLTPEIRDDSLVNHLSIPASFANAHRISIHPYNMNMGRPQLVHMYYILPLLFQNVYAAKLIHSMLALVGVAATGWLLVRTCERRALWPALYLFYSLPVVTFYATCTYIDLARIYFEVWPLWLVLRYCAAGRRSDFVIAAVIFGFGMAVHWLSWLWGWLALTGTIFFAVLFVAGMRQWKRAVLLAIAFGALSAAVFSPWIIRNWLLMGNPSQALFPEPAGGDEALRVNPLFAYYFAALRELPQRIYQAVWVISVSGNCPPILLLVALALKFFLRDRHPMRAAMLVFAWLHLLLFAVALPSQDGRYIIPGFAVSVILFFHYVEQMFRRYPRYRTYLVLGILGLGLINFATAKHRLYTDYGEPPWPVYSRQARERFLDKRFGDPTYVPLLRCLNEDLPPRSKVLLDTMIGPLYVWQPFMSHSYRDPRILYTLLRKSENNTALLEELRRYELTHILVAGDFPRHDPPAKPLTDEQYERLNQFAAKHLRLVRQIGEQRLFEIVE